MGAFDVPLDDERTQLDAFVEEYCSAIEMTLDGLTEEQVRRRLVPSATTLLGLLKHVTWMQRVWFEECVGGKSRQELGLVPKLGGVLPAHRPRHHCLRDGSPPGSQRCRPDGGCRLATRWCRH
jgi:hypothetical protein